VKLALMAVSFLVACADASEKPQQLEERIVSVAGVKVKAMIADEHEERMKGLMFVKNMPASNGMLFVWPDANERSFWMRNTYIPLDLLYVNEGKVISIIENAKPHDERQLASEGAVDMVLEVNAGWVRQHGIKPGDTLSLQ
jgi:uncharacterized membrane protein (UPF0127 family)